MHSYTKNDAMNSFEVLLRDQTVLLSSFEDLLYTEPALIKKCDQDPQKENYQFIASFEQLLRTQNMLFTQFDGLLLDDNGIRWNTELTPEEQVEFLNAYEDLLRREKLLFASFEGKLHQTWCILGGYTEPGHSTLARYEFLASFEDLLHRQVELLKDFETLEKTLSGNVPHQDLVDFLASFEDLLRLNTNLLMSFSNLLDGLDMPDATMTMPKDEEGSTWYCTNPGGLVEVSVPDQEFATYHWELKYADGTTFAPQNYPIDPEPRTITFLQPTNPELLPVSIKVTVTTDNGECDGYAETCCCGEATHWSGGDFHMDATTQYDHLVVTADDYPGATYEWYFTGCHAAETQPIELGPNQIAIHPEDKEWQVDVVVTTNCWYIEGSTGDIKNNAPLPPSDEAAVKSEGNTTSVVAAATPQGGETLNGPEKETATKTTSTEKGVCATCGTR
jgi:hypothetical protein